MGKQIHCSSGRKGGAKKESDKRLVGAADSGYRAKGGIDRQRDCDYITISKSSSLPDLPFFLFLLDIPFPLSSTTILPDYIL